MKVLLITGKISEERVRKIAEKRRCDVYVAPVDVVSFLKPEMIDAKGYDMIIVPGLVKGDLSAIEKKTQIKTYLGPKDLADLDLMLKYIGKIKFSKTVPACELLSDEIGKWANKELSLAESPGYVKKMLRAPGSMLISELPVGRAFPMRVIAEIVDVGTKTDEDILKIARYYLKSGADIVDLGFNKKNPKRVEEAVSAVKKLGAPVSIDTMDKANIRAGLMAGADLILSFDRELILEFENVRTPSVIIPKDNGILDSPKERLEVLESNVSLAKERGFENIIADPVLHPINHGFVSSVEAYRRFSGDYPLLMGAGNVTELFDADSIGINALLSGIAGEIGASLLFTTEASLKTKGCVEELKTASRMIYLSKKRGSSPKDLGIDLLRQKKKW